MNGADVIAVQAVFILQFPVAVVGVARFAWKHFQLSSRRLRHHHVEEHFGVPEIVFKAVPAIHIEADEHKALVALDACLF
ncbi:hypothetical protein D3C80_1926150 [compost metagenome]